MPPTGRRPHNNAKPNSYWKSYKLFYTVGKTTTSQIIKFFNGLIAKTLTQYVPIHFRDRIETGENRWPAPLKSGQRLTEQTGCRTISHLDSTVTATASSLCSLFKAKIHLLWFAVDLMYNLRYNTSAINTQQKINNKLHNKHRLVQQVAQLAAR